MYQALRNLGVPAELVIYPNQFHGLTRLSCIRDRYERYLAWYDKYLKAEKRSTGRSSTCRSHTTAGARPSRPGEPPGQVGRVGDASPCCALSPAAVARGGGAAHNLPVGCGVRWQRRGPPQPGLSDSEALTMQATPTCERPDEMKEMKRLVAESMRDGAIGLSAAMAYVPNAFSRTGELIQLAMVAGEYGGCYATHLRGSTREDPLSGLR